MRSRSRCAHVGQSALLMMLVSGCLGGGGESKNDGVEVDAGGDDLAGACAASMERAPGDDSGASSADALPTATRNTWDGKTIPSADDPSYPGNKYRTLAADGEGNRHPGCTTEGLSYTPANIPGYPCAAKEYPMPAGVAEDTSKPIVLLIHGNSDTPASWEAFLHPDPASISDFEADRAAREQLAEKLPALGYRTIAVDMRFDRNDDPPDSPGGNPTRNFEHGWGVPITEELIRRVMMAYPDREIALVGLSLGSTIIRDALRRLWREWATGAWDINPFARVGDVILGSGPHHGVSTYGLPDYCGENFTMRGEAACQLGQRNTYTQVPFHTPLNGPALPADLTVQGEYGGWYETPCADGSYAFGQRDACGGNVVQYTTITMKDLPDGTQQDNFVSEHSSRLYPLACADNHLNELTDFDTSGYLANGFLRNHYGGTRSDAAHDVIIRALAD